MGRIKVRSRNIKEATDDRVVLVDEVLTIWHVFFAAVIIAVMSFFLHAGISMLVYSSGDYGASVELFTRLIGLAITLIFGFIILCMLHDLLIRESVVIDGRLQSVTIEGNTYIKYIKFIKNINFSDIKHIEIGISVEDGVERSTRDVSLITFRGTDIAIYEDNCEKAEKLGQKICDITGKCMSHRQFDYTTAPTG